MNTTKEQAPIIRTCDECARTIERKPESIGTGYAWTRESDGSERCVCYPCADALQRAEIRDAAPGDRFCAYIGSDGETVTTWSGGRLGKRLGAWGALHPWSRERRYLTVRMDDGSEWYGTAAPGMWASLKKSKKNS